MLHPCAAELIFQDLQVSWKGFFLTILLPLLKVYYSKSVENVATKESLVELVHQHLSHLYSNDVSNVNTRVGKDNPTMDK
jgi:hypothetical protein